MGDGIPHLNDLALITCDNSGTLYGVASPNSPAAGIIAVYDARQELLTAECGKAHPGQSRTVIEEPQLRTIIKTSPPIQFSVRGVVAARSGRYLAVYGYDRQEDDCAVLAVVDLHGGHPLPSITQHGSQIRVKQCMVHQVDYQLFASRPGLAILQAAWHPHSDSHLVALSSDNRLRMYSLSDLSMAEQTLHLKLNTPTAGTGKAGGYGLAAAVGAEQAAAFAFGPSIGPWGPFTVYIQAASGGVFSVCPLAPFGMNVPASVVQQQAESVEQAAASGASDDSPASVASSWLCAAYGVPHTRHLSVESGSSSKTWTVKPNVLSFASPALVGPLNAGSESAAPSPHPTLSMCASHHCAESGPQGGPLQCTTVLASARADGCVWLHLLVSGPADPAWLELGPQFAVDEQGVVQAVKYECEPMPVPTAAVGNGARGAAAPGTAVLMDLIELPLPTGGSSQAQGPASNVPRITMGDDEDEEEDEDVMWGQQGRGSASPGSAHGAARLCLSVAEDAPSHIWATHAAGCWGISVSWLPTAARTLAAATALAAQPELSQLAPPVVHELLQVDVSSAHSFSQAGGSEERSENGPVMSACLLEDVFVGCSMWALQAPGRLHCMRARTALSAAPELLAASPSPSPAEASTSTGAKAGASTGSKASPLGAKSGPCTPVQPGSSSSSAHEAVEAAIQSVYGDIVGGAHSAALPKAKGPLAASSPEAAAHLTASIKALRTGSVEFVHRAHHDLRQRATQLAAEASAHMAATEELRALHASLRERQDALTASLSRALALHANLSQRAALLAQLHWSLPRPLSDAERQLSADLDVAGAKKDALLATWRALERRARAAADARRAALQPDGPVPGQGQGLSSAMNAAASGTPMRGFGLRMGSVGGGGAGTPGGFSQGSIRKGFGLLGPSASPAAAASIGRAGFPGGAAVSVAPGGSVSQPQAPSLPPAQLARVHAAVVDQYKAISVCAAEVKVMEGELAAWAAKDVKQQVEKQLAQEDGAAALGSAAATSVAAITAGK